MKHTFNKLFLAVGVLSLAACAGTATGSSRSALITNAPAPVLQQTAPAGTSLVVLRYPAVVETDAQTTFHSNYLRSPIGGSQAGPASIGEDARAIADSAVVKSNYFALSLYKELVERLPEHSVLLSPHAVTLAEDGSLTSEPITQAESIASVVTLDFAAYSFPDAEKMMSGEPLTFGDLITPLVVVRTDHRAAVGTRGVLFGSRPLLSTAGGTGTDAINTSLTSLQDGNFTSDAPELDFISYISGGTRQQVNTRLLGTTGRTNAATVYPMEKILLNRADLIALSSDATGSVDPLEDVFSSALADRVVEILNRTDMDKAAMVGRAASVSQFDPNLAALTLTGLPDEDYKARMRYTERLLQAEQRYLSVQSLRIFDGIHNGEMGAQVRDMLQAEYEIIEERRDLARRQNAATAFAVLGAVAVGVAASQTGSDVNFGEFVLLNTLTNAAIYAGTQAFALNRQSAQIGANYLTSIVPALEEQTSVQVNLLDSSETITAIRFEDLREKLQSLYSENQRAIENIGTSCGYAHNGSEPAGVWLGECDAGLAAGSGVGVIRFDDGTAAEYYGYAINGQPQGAGYMIRHTSDGSMALEGSFANGQPDGVMRVSQGGKNDTLRLYEAGRDVGTAPRGSTVVTPFVKRDAGASVSDVTRVVEVPVAPPAPIETEVETAPDTTPETEPSESEGSPAASLGQPQSARG